MDMDTKHNNTAEDKLKELKEGYHETFSIINDLTGEVVRTFTKRESKERKLKEQVKKIPAKDLSFRWRTNMFVKLYCSEELPEYNSEKFLIYWLKLTKKLSQSTNVIVNRGKTPKQDTPMTKEDMMKLLNISERTFYNFLKESMEKNIIVKNTIEGDCTRIQYVMNPLYIFNGQNINYYTFELFKHDEKFMDKITQTMKADYLTIKEELDKISS